MRSNCIFKGYSIVALQVLISTLLVAAEVPDAGRLLREQPKPSPLQPGETNGGIPPKAEPVSVDESGPAILVKGFVIKGATLIPETELKEHLKGAVGRELSFTRLQALGQTLTGYYLSKGYLARVILPPQEIKEGLVTFTIIEGKRGEVTVRNHGDRINSERAIGFIDNRLARGATLDMNVLAEAINVLNDQPGIKPTVAVKTGRNEGDVDLVLDAKESPLANYTFELNDNGSSSTGSTQGSVEAVFNNPFGIFDRASILMNASKGSEYVSGDYSWAVGTSGLRAGLSASHMEYEVKEGSFQALNPNGDATTAGLLFSYPLKRQPTSSWTLTGGYNKKFLKDNTVAGETGDAKVDGLSVGVSGTVTDSLFGGGQNDVGLALTVGDTDLSGNRSAFAADQASRRTDGGYSTLDYSYSRKQELARDWLFAVNLNGQFADNNLHSSERFSLGGLNGVRGYPSGEASGDEGYVLSANLIYSLSSNFNLSLFMDHGHIRINHDNDNLGTHPNSYELEGAGVGFNWAVLDGTTLDATVAGPIGSNPGRDANGNDSDGKSKSVRSYISLTVRF